MDSDAITRGAEPRDRDRIALLGARVPPSDNALLRQAIDRLQAILPATWTASVSAKTNDASDARLVLRTPAGVSASIAVRMRQALEPRRVPELLAGLRAVEADGHLVVAPFLGPRVRQRLAEDGCGYVDLAGNMRLALERPTVLVERGGDDQNPWAAPRHRRSLDGPKASRIVRLLCDHPPPHGIRQVAARAGTDPGYVSRLVDLLEREDVLERAPRGPVVRVDVPALVRRWGEEYEHLRTNRALAFFHPGGAEGFCAGLRGGAVPHALTGRAGAAVLSARPLPDVVACYVDNPERVAGQMGLCPAPATQANVVLLQPFDTALLDEAWEHDGLRYAVPSQIAVDLLGTPPPGPQEADELLARLAAPAQVAES